MYRIKKVYDDDEEEDVEERIEKITHENMTNEA